VRVDLSVDQGADFAVEIYWTDYNNNPFPIQAPIRMDVRGEVRGTLVELVAYPGGEQGEYRDDVTVKYSSERGRIQPLLSSEKTKSLPAGNYFYDLFVTYRDSYQDVVTGDMINATRLAKIMYGRMAVHGRVTQNV